MSASETGIAEIDREWLREKYRIERAKRLRPDGNDQYIEAAGIFQHYLEDPYVEAQPREPLTDEVTVAFIGGGFAGLVTGARLSEIGVDVRIIEKAGDFGGTWYWNRYPGAQCDTTSFVYMPLLEETGHMPTEKYARAPEILEHCQRIGKHFGLYDNACLSTEVKDLSWDEGSARWIIRTNRGDEMKAKYLAMGTGPLHRPKLPGIPGIETYKGHSFHTSRWDYDYTGGDPSEATLDRLAGKRVGIIGTGATAVQAVPHLARSGCELFVFQRTPSSIDVRNNYPTDPEWFKTLEPGWQEEWLVNFTTLQTGGFAEKDLVMDGWTDLAKRIRDKAIELGQEQDGFTAETFIRAYEESDDEKMEEIRARVDQVVEDPATSGALKAWYRQLCKRPCFHDQYLQAYNNPNVHLVDTDGEGVEAIDETGLVAQGEHYELDCIIYASGFEVGTGYTRRAGFDATGRGGIKLSEYWNEGMRSLHGLQVHGFPNMFVVGFSQAANLISNVPHNFVDHALTIRSIIEHAEATGAEEVEVTDEAEQAWITMLLENPRMFGGNQDCTPGYYNNEGQEPGPDAFLNSAGYPGGPMAYFQYIDNWRNSGRFDGLDFR